MPIADSPAYLEKKQRFQHMLTLYGRKPVLEALMTEGVNPFRLHLADSNKAAKILDDIESLAKRKGAEVCVHSKDALSRISKNKKQDQGVALDIQMRGFMDVETFLRNAPENFSIIALDRVTNPQNLGMIIRSVAASPITAVLVPQQGCAKIDSLVIKASAGALFKATLVRCDALMDALQTLRTAGADIVGLAANATTALTHYQHPRAVYVLGNESEGLSPQIEKCCTTRVKIPMNNAVESLNVAVTASLIAFRSVL